MEKTIKYTYLYFQYMGDKKWRIRTPDSVNFFNIKYEKLMAIGGIIINRKK